MSIEYRKWRYKYYNWLIIVVLFRIFVWKVVVIVFNRTIIILMILSTKYLSLLNIGTLGKCQRTVSSSIQWSIEKNISIKQCHYFIIIVKFLLVFEVWQQFSLLLTTAMTYCIQFFSLLCCLFYFKLCRMLYLNVLRFIIYICKI